MSSSDEILTYGFYDALYQPNDEDELYDRLYHSGQMSQLFDGIIIDGVYLTARNDDITNQQFKTNAIGGMVVRVSPGKAWFNGTYTISDSYIDLTFDASSNNYDRIDAIVIEVNTSIDVRANSIHVVKGTAASPALRPTLTHTEYINQYPIAYVTIREDTTIIRPYDIEYVVGIDTPYFAWVCENLSVAELYSKWEPKLGAITVSFTKWFESMQRMLVKDADNYENIKTEIALVNDHDYIKGVLPKVNEQNETFTGDGSTRSFTLTGNVNKFADVLINGSIVFNYYYNKDTNAVIFQTAPANGASIVIYYVPVINAVDTYTLYFEEV